MSRTKRIIYIVLGSIFLILGGIGVFLPLLPTTPFWLLTCWFYIRSSERLYNKLMSTHFFGDYIRAYMVDKSIPMKAKVFSVSLMTASILFCCIYVVDQWWLRVLLLLICIGVAIHILSFPTRKKEDAPTGKSEE